MGRWLLGVELARARAASQPPEREAALSRAGDAYERARSVGLGNDPEAGAPGPRENAWRRLGWIVARLLAGSPALRQDLEDRLLGPRG